MADWADISYNAKKHGDFAGRSKTEQDAYFEFFASTQREAFSLRLFIVFARIIRSHPNSGLRLPSARVAFPDPAARK